MKTSENNLQHLLQCPVCTEKYHPMRATLLGEENEWTTFHVVCEKCKTASLVFVSADGQLGMVSLGMITDLGREEAKKMYKDDIVSIEHVIQMHSYLKTFKGTTAEFFYN